MMAKYLETKEQYKDCILFYRLGDFYEMFFDDALTASKALEITLTGKDCGLEERAPMCGIPYHAADTYLNRLVAKGYKVAICEQVEDPKQAKGLVKREVIRILKNEKPTEENLAKLREFAERHENYVVKPVYAAFGNGVRVENLGMYDSVEEAHQEYSKSGAVIEEVIIQGEAMSKIHAGSVNTLRIPTAIIKNEEGEQVETDWDTALDTAAGKLREIAEKYGPDSIGVIYQVQGTGHIQKGALVRIANTFGWSIIGGYELNGDLPMFWPETFGCQSEELESYCWEDSKLTLVFGSNVMVTRMPDAHFLTYSQENGGKVIYFDPNYSASAEKANEWVRIAPDSDGAFALAMAKTIIDEDLYDKHFMQTYTDSPFLINLETGKKILAEEVQGLSPTPGLPDFRKSYVAVDQTSGALQATNPLKLDDNNYALMGSYDVPLKDGTTAKAKTGFQLLTEQLENYTPEAVADICKIDADTITRIAREAATVKPMHIIFGGGTQQWYHGDLKGRACALVACLTGNVGQLGGGISTYVGQYKTRFNTASWMVPEGAVKNSCPFHYWVNGPTPQMTAKYPKHGFKALVVGWGNPLEQHNVANWLRHAFESGELEYLVCMEFQDTLTASRANVTFPCASWYEKTELTTTPLHPYVQLQQRIVEPPGEAPPHRAGLARHASRQERLAKRSGS